VTFSAREHLKEGRGGSAKYIDQKGGIPSGTMKEKRLRGERGTAPKKNTDKHDLDIVRRGVVGGGIGGSTPGRLRCSLRRRHAGWGEKNE